MQLPMPPEMNPGRTGHEIVTYLFHVPIPFGLNAQQVEFEDNRWEPTLPEIFDSIVEWDEDELKRVIAAAAVLLAKYPHRSVAAAFNTAMVWERG